MPTITRLFLKSGLLYLVIAIGIEMLANLKGASLQSTAIQFRPTAYHFFFIGWLTQMIFGVSHWFFPTVNRRRGNILFIYLSFGALNSGLWLRFFSEAALWAEIIPWRHWLLVFSSSLQWIGFLAYAVHIWPRIKLKGH